MDSGGALFIALAVGSTGATAFDAARFSRDEYQAAFRRPDMKYYFVTSPLLLFCCGAGLGAPLLYFLWARQRLVRVRDGEEIKAPLLVRATDRMMVGNWERGLQAVDLQLAGALERGDRAVTVRVSEHEVGFGLVDGWSAFADLVMEHVENAGGSIVNINEIGAPGTRTLVVHASLH